MTLIALMSLLASPEDSGTRHEVMMKLGQRVKRVLEGRDAKEVSLGKMREVRVGDDKKKRDPEAEAGTGLMHDLARVLAKLEVKLSEKADFELRGTYEMVGDGGEYVIDVSLELVARKKMEILIKFPGRLTYLQEVLEVTGLTVDLPPNPSKEVVKKAMLKATDDERTAALDGTRVKASKESPYSIELLQKTPRGYVAFKPVGKKGEAFVGVSKDDVYAVRVTNDSEVEAAVSLSIDGLNAFSFAKGVDPDKGGYPRFLVPAKSSRVFKGWPIDLKTSREFLVTSYPDAAAHKLDKPSDLGLVSVVLTPSWLEGKKPAGYRKFDGPLGTGLGEPIKTALKMVKREFGDNPTSIHIRYAAK